MNWEWGHSFFSVRYPPGPHGWIGTQAWIGDRLVYDDTGEGAWPKPIYPEPPCGWDERDALV